MYTRLKEPFTILDGMEALKLVLPETLKGWEQKAKTDSTSSSTCNDVCQEKAQLKYRKVWSITNTPITKSLGLALMNLTKSLPFDDDRVSRRFSVSSINFTQLFGRERIIYLLTG
ncbi:hypothetical protein PsorP6_008737 [Peronosclerospora sorghi]|uniref:Uncharacterized protein n=1 Tax=Peronosclerospora sorghi TaxID=230839 RepID=A0ACC0VZ05_9STRA|nr:hypothetical protein PsorP6_008737 [Peronosclerospora sorghi]